jgi:hypothetical protein
MKSEWQAFLNRKGIKEQAALERIIRNVLAMDDLAASLLLDQITDPRRRRQAAEILLKDLAKPARKPKASGGK